MSQQMQPMQTSFANQRSKTAYEKAGEAGRGKLWHLPGRTTDKHFKPNTVFASHTGMPDESAPIASFASITNSDGTLGSKMDFYDNHAESMQSWMDLIDKYGDAHAAYKQVENSPSVAAIVNKSTIDQTKSLNIMDQVLGLQHRNYFLNEVVTEIAANQLVFTVDRFNEGTVEAKVPEMVEPQLISHSEERTTKILYKNVGHIAESEEARLMSLHNTMQLRQDKTIKDMARLINSQIATVLGTATALAGSDWGALSPSSAGEPDSINNPINDIQPAMTAIESDGFNTDWIVGHNRPIADLSTNKFIAGRANVGNPADLMNQRTTFPGLPTAYRDQALPETMVVIGNKDSVWRGVGPTVVASYDEESSGYSGWLIKQWTLPYIAEMKGLRRLTGVSA